MTGTRPTAVLVHDHGASGWSSSPLAAALRGEFDVVVPELAVDAELADAVDVVVGAIRADGAHRWLLVGHGAGGAIATRVAVRTLAGTVPVFGLAGVVLLAGSPPAPGTTDHDRRPPALEVPALALAGDADADPGATARSRRYGATYRRMEFLTLPGAGHLLASEHPDRVAAAITDFWTRRAGRGPGVSPDAARLIASDRVTARVRGVLARRSLADEPAYAPKVLDVAQLTTLRAVAGRIVPQEPDGIDLAARLDARLAAGAGDGWRHATLPDDRSAHRAALSALHGLADRSEAEQDDILRAVAAGEHEVPTSTLSAASLALWFQDVCDDLVRLWTGHPATLALLDFDGYADGGDISGRTGFLDIGRGERDAWEPPARAHAANGGPDGRTAGWT